MSPTCCATVEAVAAAGVPVLVMTYWNPVDHYGVDAFARDLASAGGCGLITPDLPPEEAGPWLEAAAAHDLDPVFLVAPSSTDERIKLITAACGGFVYAASVMGITGARAAVGGAAAGLVERIRQHTSAAGGGRARGEHRGSGRRGGAVRRRGHRRLGIRAAPAQRAGAGGGLRERCRARGRARRGRARRCRGSAPKRLPAPARRGGRRARLRNIEFTHE